MPQLLYILNEDTDKTSFIGLLLEENEMIYIQYLG